MFADEQRDPNNMRDPVPQPLTTKQWRARAATHRPGNGPAVQGFCTLIEQLVNVVGNSCRTHGSGTTARSFRIVTSPLPTQRRATELLQNITV